MSFLFGCRPIDITLVRGVFFRMFIQTKEFIIRKISIVTVYLSWLIKNDKNSLDMVFISVKKLFITTLSICGVSYVPKAA